MAILGLDVHPLAPAQFVAFKFDEAFFQRIQGVILSHSNIISRMKAGSSLANNDIPGYYFLHDNENVSELGKTILCIGSGAKCHLRSHPLTSPPNFFTPRFFGLESRPFFVDPAVFLVAHRLNVKLSPPPVTSN